MNPIVQFLTGQRMISVLVFIDIIGPFGRSGRIVPWTVSLRNGCLNSSVKLNTVNPSRDGGKPYEVKTREHLIGMGTNGGSLHILGNLKKFKD